MDFKTRRLLEKMFLKHYGDSKKRDKINTLINGKDHNLFIEKLEKIKVGTRLSITSRNVTFFPSYGFRVLLSDKSFDNIKNITELHIQISCIDKIYTGYVVSTFYERLTIQNKNKLVVHNSTIFLHCPEEYRKQFNQIMQRTEFEWPGYSYVKMNDLLFKVNLNPKLTYVHSDPTLFYHAFFAQLRTDLMKIVR